MEAYWNKLTLDKPPTVSWRCAPKDFDLQRFSNDIERIVRELETQTIFRTEAAILSRLIYRMKSKLRSDKGLKNMEKTNRALLNYLKLSLENEYKYLADNVKREENILILPTRQMLQYVLVRTQGFAKLMCRIENISEIAGGYFRNRIGDGHAWNMSMVAYSVISRIWFLSRHLTKKCCEWYDKMYEYHKKLKMVGVPWLPENYCLPDDLEKWLNVPWINKDFNEIVNSKTLSNGIFTLISQQTDKTDSEEFLVEDNRDAQNSSLSPVIESHDAGSLTEKPADPKSVPQIQINSQSFSLDEIGKRVSRKKFERNESTKVCPAKKRKIFEDQTDDVEARSRGKILQPSCENKIKLRAMKVENIKTKEDLTKFLNLKKYPGLDKLQWKILTKNVSKLLLKMNKSNINCSPKKQDVSLKKIIRSIREWIN